MPYGKKLELEEKFINKVPDWLFCFIANLYCLIHPKEEKVRLLPKGDSWLLQRKDSQLLFPKSVHRIFRPDPYERYFKIAPDETVLDVGACFGDTTIPFAKKSKKVVAIEAGPENVAYLKMNVAISGLQNVYIVEKATWNCRKTLTLHLSKSIDRHSIVRNMGEKIIEVQADTIDNIVSELGIEKVDFIKMDIEGAEVEALEGAENILSKAKKIVLETHTVDGKKTTHKVQRILKAQGFKVHIEHGEYSADMVYGKRRGYTNEKSQGGKE